MSSLLQPPIFLPHKTKREIILTEEVRTMH